MGDNKTTENGKTLGKYLADAIECYAENIACYKSEVECLKDSIAEYSLYISNVQEIVRKLEGNAALQAKPKKFWISVIVRTDKDGKPLKYEKQYKARKQQIGFELSWRGYTLYLNGNEDVYTSDLTMLTEKNTGIKAVTLKTFLEDDEAYFKRMDEAIKKIDINVLSLPIEPENVFNVSTE